MRSHLRADRHRGQRGGPRGARWRPTRGSLRFGHGAVREERRPLPRPAGAHGRDRPRPTRASTPRFAWAKVGMDKGMATNPLLGTGLLAGFRTSGESERPGFAWMFGRDALWTALAITSYGDFAATRTALDFLRQVPARRRQDPARDLAERVARAVVDRLRVPLGLRRRDPAVRDRARRSLARDRRPRVPRRVLGVDREGVAVLGGDGHATATASSRTPRSATDGRKAARPIRRTRRSTCRGSGSRPRGPWPSWRTRWATPTLAAAARAAAEKCRQAVEKTYWLKDAGYYAFATALAKPEKEYNAEAGAAARRPPGPHRRPARRSCWSTRTPCCPRCRCGGGRSTRSARSRRSTTSASAAMATDWGHRLLSDRSELYDPLSYHYGSVWRAVHGMGVDGRVPLRPAPRGLPGG